MDEAYTQEQNIPVNIVLVDGQELSDEIKADILSVTVNLYSEGPDMFSVNLDAWDADTQEIQYVDDVFREGSVIEIKMGYNEEVESLLTGEITAIEVEFHDNESPIIILQGYDKLHRIRRGTKTQFFSQIKDNDIVQQIADAAGINVEVEDTVVEHEHVLQYNQTDLDFLIARANKIRYELKMEGETLFFRPARNGEGNVVSMEYGQSLRKFFPRSSTMTQVSEIQVKGWNPKDKEAILASAKSGEEVSRMEGDQLGVDITNAAFGEAKGIIVNNPVVTQAEADQIAMAKFNDMNVKYLSGDATAIGDPRIRAGDVIELSKLGQRFSGLYYIVKAQHYIDPQKKDGGGYTTEFCVMRNAT